MASWHLDHRRILELHAATIEAGLDRYRAALLQGIDAAFVASLPVSPAPSAQILTDLHCLDLTLADGSVPLGRWLENAFVLAGPKAVGAVFEAALVELGLPLPARPFAASTALREAPRSAPAHRTDVVILAAVQDELEAVLALGDEGRRGWEEARDLQGFPYFRRSFARDDGGSLVIAAAWIGAMGQDVDTALRGQQLVAELGPACLAMCGICGGWRRKVALGDIVVADQLYVYDHGKLIAGEGPESGFHHHLEGYGPGRVWKMDAAFFARAFELDALARERPRSLAGQRAWLLRALHAHEHEGAQPPDKHPDRKALCPAWRHLVPTLRDEGAGGSRAAGAAARRRALHLRGLSRAGGLHPLHGLAVAPPRERSGVPAVALRRAARGDEPRGAALGAGPERLGEPARARRQARAPLRADPGRLRRGQIVPPAGAGAEPSRGRRSARPGARGDALPGEDALAAHAPRAALRRCGRWQRRYRCFPLHAARGARGAALRRLRRAGGARYV